MKFIDNETNEVIDFTPYDDENQNLLILFMANKVISHDNKHYSLAHSQTVFDLRSGIVEIEIQEVGTDEL